MADTELAIEDQLSDVATINFYRRYFLEEEGERNYEFTLEPTAARKLVRALGQDEPPSVKEFCDAIFQEYYSSTLIDLLEEADESEFRIDLEQELGIKLSLDGEKLSLSALDIFTKTVGLE